MNAVLIDHLCHSYPRRKKSDTPRWVLEDVSLSVEPGEIFGLLGPNGGGKSTLFKILSTALIPVAGSAQIFDADVVKNPAEARQKLGVVFQSPSLDKKLTLRENAVHQGHLYGLSGSDLQQRIDAMFARLSLTPRLNDFVETLSGGLQRRGEIAKSLLHKPSLLLMDEPSTGLDPGARHELWDTLFQLKKEGVTILLTTHLMEEGDKCDRLGILNEGHLVTLGTPESLKQKIGGDVISVQSNDPAILLAKINDKFNVTAAQFDQTIRFEIQDGHKVIPQLVELSPGAITSVTVGKPTLEDVFVHETGQRFYRGNER